MVYLSFVANLPEHIFVWNEALKSLHKHIFISEKQRFTESPSCAGHISPKLIQFFSDMMAVSCVCARIFSKSHESFEIRHTSKTNPTLLC